MLNIEDAAQILRKLAAELSPNTGSIADLWRDRTRLVEILAAQPPTFEQQRAHMIAAIRADLMARAEFPEQPLDRALAAVGSVPREAFMHPEIEAFAYLPGAFALSHGQTISNPHLVAVMTLAADPPAGGRVLDVGTGSGYQAAVLSRLAREVVSVEILEPLACSADERLRRLGYNNVRVEIGDGSAGSPAHAPFDTIVVAAGAAMIPTALLDQLRPGGRLVMPVGPSSSTELLVVASKSAWGTVVLKSLGSAAFVPLTGEGARKATGKTRRNFTTVLPSFFGADVT